jgi:hypothetical protein
LPEEVVRIIIKESEDNRQLAAEFLHNTINVSFPEITKALQNKKAAHSILNLQNGILLSRTLSMVA